MSIPTHSPSRAGELLAEARALYQSGELLHAERVCRGALAAAPRDPEAIRLLGWISCRLGAVGVGVGILRRAVKMAPDLAVSHRSLAEGLILLGQWDEAEPSLRRALELDPLDAKTHQHLGLVLQVRRRWSEAEAAFARALTLDPHNARSHLGLGIIAMSQARPEEAEASFRRSIALDPESPSAHSCLLFALHYQASCSRDRLFAEACDWGQRYAEPLWREAFTHANEPVPERRLRIGYVSGDFGHHPVGHILEPVLEAHDTRQVEVFCYSTAPGGDDVTARLQAKADHWRSLSALDDRACADMIHDDKIDILVDLSGHTAGGRLLALARKPAPIQVSWLGYFDTTGIRAMDYLLADRVVAPEAEDHYYVEQVVRLPDAWWCFKPPAYSAAYDNQVRPLPALERGYVTFGCFNNAAKITLETVSVWAAILRAIPQARLALKNSAFGEAEIQDRYTRLFAHHGIAADRIVFEGRASYAEYIGAYAGIDIALDPFPYNGGMTSLEALWMGVPLVALRGDRFVGRLGCTALSSVGLEHLIADSRDEYVAKAVALAGDLNELVKLRSGLRERMARSPVCDPAKFTRDLEATYRTMWSRWCASRGA